VSIPGRHKKNKKKRREKICNRSGSKRLLCKKKYGSREKKLCRGADAETSRITSGKKRKQRKQKRMEINREGDGGSRPTLVGK